MAPRILVVDDEPAVLQVIRRHLEDAGFECATANTAAGAMEQLDPARLPDLMVVDVRLPEIPGPELALRIHNRYPRLPVLFISGWIDGLAEPSGLEALEWAFLPKPFAGESLVETIRRMLSQEQDAIPQVSPQ